MKRLGNWEEKVLVKINNEENNYVKIPIIRTIEVRPENEPPSVPVASLCNNTFEPTEL